MQVELLILVVVIHCIIKVAQVVLVIKSQIVMNLEACDDLCPSGCDAGTNADCLTGCTSGTGYTGVDNGDTTFTCDCATNYVQSGAACIGKKF